MQKFVQELVWREFWQMTWIDKNINEDLRTGNKKIIKILVCLKKSMILIPE